MRRCGSILLALGASVLLASAGRAEDADKSDATKPEAMLQKGIKLSRSCLEPKPDWPEDKLSGNFDTCNDALQMLVRAVKVTKDVKAIEEASPALTLLNVNMATTALRMGRNYAEHDKQKAALAFFRVACTSFDAAASFETLKPEQADVMKTGAAEADRLLEKYHSSCKTILGPG